MNQIKKRKEVKKKERSKKRKKAAGLTDLELEKKFSLTFCQPQLVFLSVPTSSFFLSSFFLFLSFSPLFSVCLTRWIVMEKSVNR